MTKVEVGSAKGTMAITIHHILCRAKKLGKSRFFGFDCLYRKITSLIHFSILRQFTVGPCGCVGCNEFFGRKGGELNGEKFACAATVQV
jgi:hypothetical protein